MIRRPRIRAPKRSTAVDVPTLWKDKFGPAVEHILKRSSSTLSFDDLYRSCYLLVNQQQGRALYKAFNEFLKAYLVNQLLPTVHPHNAASFAQIWSDYALALSLMGDIFMYLNRGFCLDAKLPSIERSGELLFRDNILRPNAQILYRLVVDTIDQERDGISVDTDSISIVTQMLYSLASGDINSSDNMFNDELLPALVNSTKEYYTILLGQLLPQNPDARTIMNKLKSWVDKEKVPKLYLPSKTNEILCHAIEEDLLPDALAKAFTLPSGLSLWIESNDSQSLALAAELESRSGVEDSALVQTIGDVVRTNQTEYNSQALKLFQEGGAKALDTIAVDWVNNSIGLKKKIDGIYSHIENYFNSNKKGVLDALNNVWAECANKLQVKAKKSMPEFLAIFSDQLLKKSSTYRSDTEIDQSMDDCIILFAAVADKEAFSTSYGVKLGRRLLQNKSQSEDLERLFLSKLKAATGHVNTSHFQIMMTDMESSQLLSHQFNQLGNEINTKINVGRSGIWDGSYTKNKTARLPPILEDIRAKFELFYSEKHFKRKLTWNYKIGSADIKLNIGDTNYLVTLPLICLSILWLFKGDEEFSTLQIQEATDVNLEDLIPTLQALSQVKSQRFLVKTPLGREVNQTDVFKFNSEFKSPKKLIRVQLLSSYVRSEASKTDAESMRRLEAGRNEQIQAAAVRVMKARKTLSHSLLVQEVTSILSSRFEASPQLIKRSINDLIDKEYFTRDVEDANTYIYVA